MEINMGEDQAWMGWETLTIPLDLLDSAALARCLGTQFVAAAQNRTTVVLCNTHRRAHSRRFRMEKLAWNHAKRIWEVKFVRV